MNFIRAKYDTKELSLAVCSLPLIEYPPGDRMRPRLALFMVIGLLVAETACVPALAPAPSEQTVPVPPKKIFVPIKEIREHPRAWLGKTVNVSGMVSDVFPLIFVPYFVLSDDTGEIRVITSTLPNQGQRVEVEGTVDETFSIGAFYRIVIRQAE